MALHLNGAQTLVRLLQAEHVPAAFGIVGGKLAPLLHAISRSNIRFHGVRHEAGGADDGRGGVCQHRPRGGGAGRDGAGRR